MTTALLLLALALLLVLLCGMFVAAEFAFVTVDRAQVDKAASEGDATAAGVQRALRSLSTQLSGAQVGITATNLGIGFLAEPAIAELLDDPLEGLGLAEGAVGPVALATSLVLSTILTMLIGELVPKNIALALPMATARATQGPMRVFTTAIRLPIRVLNGAANAIVRWFGIEPQEELRSARSSTELASLIQRSAYVGTLDAETAELMERSVEFGTRTAGEIMTPRVRTHSLEENDRASAVIDLARETGHSRFPVLDDQDTVVGTVHVKNAVALPVAERATTKVKHLMARPIVVPDSLRLDPLMGLLRRDGFQLAVVLDEYGGQAGIVTLEDVVEEIVGDIADEHDRLGSRGRLRRDGSWSVSGLLRPDEIEDLTEIELPEGEDYDTVAGLVLKALGRIPTPGESVVVPLAPPHDEEDPPRRNAVLTVEHMDGLRIDRLALRSSRRRRAMNEVSALLLTVVLLAGNAFFVATEFALISARRSQIEPRAQAGSRLARTTLRALGQMPHMIAGIQLGVTVCSLRARRHLRAGDRPPDRAVVRGRAPAARPAAPGRLRHRAEHHRVPARGAGRDGAEEHHPRRPRPRRPAARATDARPGDRAQAGDRRARHDGEGDPAGAARGAEGRDELDLHPRGGRGAGRGVARRGPAREGRVRPAGRRARLHREDGRGRHDATRAR